MPNESRLIDINPIIRNLTAMKSMYDAIALDGMIKALDEAPTVDAVEVVRCKDCVYWGQDACSSTGDDESFCTNPDGLDNFVHPDDFCSYGERKNDNATD